MYPVDLNNSATWRFLAGNGGSFFMPEDNVQHIVNLGANGSYVGVYLDAWGDTTPRWKNNLSMTEHLQRFSQEMHRLGGIIYQQQAVWGWSMDANWDIYAAHQRDVFNNVVVDGVNQQDLFINWVKDVVVGFQPDVCQIINEVRGDNYPNDWDTGGISEAFWTNYINFCNRFMAELSVAPYNQRIFTVSGMPFWDLKGIAQRSSRFIVPANCKLLYSYHYYYSSQRPRWRRPPLER